jgi:hypothetical protein
MLQNFIGVNLQSGQVISILHTKIVQQRCPIYIIPDFGESWFMYLKILTNHHPLQLALINTYLLHAAESFLRS